MTTLREDRARDLLRARMPRQGSILREAVTPHRRGPKFRRGQRTRGPRARRPPSLPRSRPRSPRRRSRAIPRAYPPRRVPSAPGLPMARTADGRAAQDRHPCLGPTPPARIPRAGRVPRVLCGSSPAVPPPGAPDGRIPLLPLRAGAAHPIPHPGGTPLCGPEAPPGLRAGRVTAGPRRRGPGPRHG